MKNDPELCVEVPDHFDDSDADSQVHAVAKRLFFSPTNAGAFAAAHEWISAHAIHVLDTSWNSFPGEESPFCLGVYFTFDPDDE